MAIYVCWLLLKISFTFFLGIPFSFQLDNNHQYDFPYSEQDDLPGVLDKWRDDLQGRRDKNKPVEITDAKTEYGPVQGFIVKLYDNPLLNSGYKPLNNQQEEVQATVRVFLGIPYAKPPIGDLRFRPPFPPKPWLLYQAMDYGPVCPQPIKYIKNQNIIQKMSEDCLYLNIFAPNNPHENKKYPVMVYLHGGHYTHGSSNEFLGHMMAAFYDVIIVTVNYRLGALGFLSTPDQYLPGNYGIFDQIIALKWVYNNIKYFMGNEQSITLFGPDAGAASSTILMLAPHTRHIITKVIAQSGSLFADWALFNNSYKIQNISRNLAQSLGCADHKSNQLLNCLKESRSFYDIGNVQLSPDFIGLFPWAPVYYPFQRKKSIFSSFFTQQYSKNSNFFDDYCLLNDEPENLIKNHSFHSSLRVMAGLTTQEASDLVDNLDFRFSEQDLSNKIREIIQKYNYTFNSEGIFQAIKFMYYTNWPNGIRRSFLDQYIDILSDMLYVAPLHKLIDLLVKESVPVYLYVLNTTAEGLKRKPWETFAHNTEYYFLTGAPFMDVEMFPSYLNLTRTQWTANDRNMSHFFMKAYTNFAHYGNPSFTQILGLHFERASVDDLRYLNINTTFNSSIMSNYRAFHSAFWNSYLPHLIQQNFRIESPFWRFSEYWWSEPREPTQIAFWSISALALFLLFLLVACCILWRHEKLKLKLSKDLLMMEPSIGIGPCISGGTEIDEDNQYHNLEMFPEIKTSLIRPVSNESDETILKSSSNLTSTDNTLSSRPIHKTTPLLDSGLRPKPKTQVIQGIPQTDV